MELCLIVISYVNDSLTYKIYLWLDGNISIVSRLINKEKMSFIQSNKEAEKWQYL